MLQGGSKMFQGDCLKTVLGRLSLKCYRGTLKCSREIDSKMFQGSYFFRMFVICGGCFFRQVVVLLRVLSAGVVAFGWLFLKNVLQGCFSKMFQGVVSQKCSREFFSKTFQGVVDLRCFREVVAAKYSREVVSQNVLGRCCSKTFEGGCCCKMFQGGCCCKMFQGGCFSK